jgi:heat shock protein HslJ
MYRKHKMRQEGITQIMFVKRSVLLLVLVGGAIMAACAGDEQGEPSPDSGEGGQLPADGGAASGRQMVGHQIIGDWNLVSLNGHSLVEGSTITASFDGAQITGSACNHYFGAYTVGAGDISFSGIGSTEMFCEDTMEQEQEYFEALAEVNGWNVEGATLELFGETASLVFERNVPPSDVDLEGTNWTLESFVIGGDAVSSLIAGTAISATIANGEISGNATCNSYSGAVSIDGAGITISQIAMTEMACETGMDQESHYLQTLAEVSTWRIDGLTLTLSADNGNGLVFRAVQ